MTGASSGLGRQAAIEMLREHPDLELVVIGRSDPSTVVEDLWRASGSANVRARLVDLSSTGPARVAAAQLREELQNGSLPPLAGFVGNAGVEMRNGTGLTPDGLEITFAVNVLANFLLIQELRDELRPPARIVLTTSDTHFGDFRHTLGTVPAPRWDEVPRLVDGSAFKQDDRVTAGRRAYSTSKLAIIYLAHALARRVPDGVEIFSYNPGLVPATGLLRNANGFERFAFRWLLPALIVTPLAQRARAAGKQLAAAAVGTVAAPSGAYLNGTSAQESSPESYDTDREEELWAGLETLLRRVPAAADQRKGER